MDIEFANLKELYERLLPALKNKRSEIKRLSNIDIEEIKIWEYLKEKKWKNSYNLLLYQMVDDILNVDNLILIDYYKKESV